MCFRGRKSIEFSLPISTTEVSCSLWKVLNPTRDTVYMRMYQKFDAGYNVPTSNHNGIRLSAKYPEVAGRKPPANGTGFFLFHAAKQRAEGRRDSDRVTTTFTFTGRSSDRNGDHWLSRRHVMPYSSSFGNKGDWLAYPSQYPDFKPYPMFLPQRDQWYCYELMVKANTPGKNDGEVKWLD